MMTCICAKLVSVAHANHIEYIFVFFLFLYLENTSLNSDCLKFMTKSPITDNSDTNYNCKFLLEVYELEVLQ